MKPMLDPEKDLKGATPETLANALLRPAKVRKTAGKGKVTVKKTPLTATRKTRRK